jgi:hypothetical protein
MSPTIKNILIGVVVAGALAGGYFFFIKKAPEEAVLSSSSGDPAVSGGNTTAMNSEISKDFISLLLSVRSIKLDDSILKDQSFLNLKDTTITIVQTDPEGRPNPFAPIGAENIVIQPEIQKETTTDKKTTTKNDKTSKNPTDTSGGNGSTPSPTTPPPTTPPPTDPNPDLNIDPNAGLPDNSNLPPDPGIGDSSGELDPFVDPGADDPFIQDLLDPTQLEGDPFGDMGFTP